MAAACALGFSGVGLGALGAHFLRDKFIPDGTRVWSTAVQYHLLHAVAMLATQLALRRGGLSPALASKLSLAHNLWGGGVLFFSGSLYVLALDGPRVFGPVTPIGGLLMMAGWAAAGLGFAAAPGK